MAGHKDVYEDKLTQFKGRLAEGVTAGRMDTRGCKEDEAEEKTEWKAGGGDEAADSQPTMAVKWQDVWERSRGRTEGWK